MTTSSKITVAMAAAIALTACTPLGPALTPREASHVEVEHLRAFLDPNSGVLRMWAVDDSVGRVVFGWLHDPLKQAPVEGIWRFAGTDSLDASRFAALTTTSERLATPHPLVAWQPPDSVSVGHFLKWLGQHPVQRADTN